MSDDVRIQHDPALDAVLARDLIEIWTDVTNAGGAVGFVPPVTPDDVRPVAQSTFDEVGRGAAGVAVAFVGQKPIGFGFLRRGRAPLFAHVATVNRLQVHPDHRARGVGGRLLDELVGRARDEGAEIVHLTARGGLGLEGFYALHGFELAATLPDLIKLGEGDYRDELHFLRHLAP